MRWLDVGRQHLRLTESPLSIARLMREQADAGRAVFLVTHDLELLESCDRALVMTDLQKKCAG